MKWSSKITLTLLVVMLIVLMTQTVSAQCCAVGSGSPIAGDASVGVLKEGQLELNSNFQWVASNKFLNGNHEETNFLKDYSSHYLFNRIAFGLSERLTFSVEMGYWIKKQQTGLRDGDTYSSKGLGDLILMPRFNLIKASGHNRFTELTLGMGFKLPLGNFNDSLGVLEPFSGETFFITKPLAVQVSSGANDMLFNMFYAGTLSGTKIRLAANTLYIHKGWNPIGEKLGDYISLGIFASRPIGEKLNVALQLRGEWIGKMQFNPDIFMVRFISYDPEATGSSKYFVSPQLSYLFAQRLTVFLQSEMPLYQHVNQTQIASQHQITAGLTYRFQMKNSKIINPVQAEQ